MATESKDNKKALNAEDFNDYRGLLTEKEFKKALNQRNYDDDVLRRAVFIKYLADQEFFKPSSQASPNPTVNQTNGHTLSKDPAIQLMLADSNLNYFLTDSWLKSKKHCQANVAFQRSIFPQFQNWLCEVPQPSSPFQVLVVHGIRRSGKTTMIKQSMAWLHQEKKIAAEEILYLSLQRTPRNEPGLLHAIGKWCSVKKFKYVFFDEIQELKPGWQDDLRFVMDMYGDEYHIVISGSESDLIRRGLDQPMFGRYISFQMKPFSFKEALQCCNLTQPTEEFFLHYVSLGGFPRVVTASSVEEAKSVLTTINESITNKDLERILKNSMKYEEFKNDLEEFGLIANPESKIQREA